MSQHLLAHIHPGALHHAYCIFAPGITEASAHAPFFAFLETHLAIPTRGNPDFWHGQFESFGVDEARALKDMQQRAAANVGAKKVFVISTDTITHEAQNALLKVLEEPTADTHFFLLIPSAEVLLPTLRSRLVSVPLGQDISTEDASVVALAEKFFVASKGKRMALLKSLAEEKDKRAAAALIDALLKKLSKSAQDTKHHQKDLEILLEMRSYLSDRSASVKMILEYLCVSLK